MAKKAKPATLPEKIKSILTRNKWTVSKLATEVGVTKAAVYMWIDGTRVASAPVQKLLDQLLAR